MKSDSRPRIFFLIFSINVNLIKHPFVFKSLYLLSPPERTEPGLNIRATKYKFRRLQLYGVVRIRLIIITCHPHKLKFLVCTECDMKLSETLDYIFAKTLHPPIKLYQSHRKFCIE